TAVEAHREIDAHLLEQIDLLILPVLANHRETAKELADLALGRLAANALLGAQAVMRRVSDRAKPHRARDQALGDAPELLRLGLGGLDALVRHQIGRQRAEHRATMARVAAELPPGFPVPHDSALLRLLLPAF